MTETYYAYRQGLLAGKARHAVGMCPYNPTESDWHKESHRLWMNGWKDGRSIRNLKTPMAISEMRRFSKLILLVMLAELLQDRRQH